MQYNYCEINTFTSLRRFYYFRVQIFIQYMHLVRKLKKYIYLYEHKKQIDKRAVF